MSWFISVFKGAGEIKHYRLGVSEGVMVLCGWSRSDRSSFIYSIKYIQYMNVLLDGSILQSDGIQ